MNPAGILLGLGLVVVVSWLLFLALLLIVRPHGVDLGEALRFVPDVLRLVRGLARDRSLSRRVRVPLFLLLAYLASPLDLVPDFLPVLGYADDVILIAAVLRFVIRRAGPGVVTEAWPGTAEGLAVLRRLVGASAP